MSKFKDLNEMDDIETIASTLKECLEENKKEYETMKADGIIDEDELNRIITTMQDLEFKARSLKEGMDSDSKKAIMEEIIAIVNGEQVKMINAKNNPVIEQVEGTKMELQ